MKYNISGIKIREILNSGGGIAVEAEVMLLGGNFGRASAPVAILPGRRETTRTFGLDSEKSSIISDLNIKVQEFKGCSFISQEGFDSKLESWANILGSDVCLALSLAFARAAASSSSCNLVSYISKLAKTTIKMPYPLVAVFSGGIHNSEGNLPFQQIMLAVNISVLDEALLATKKIYKAIEDLLKKRKLLNGYSSSSGMIANEIGMDEMFEIVTKTIHDLGYIDLVGIAVDIAAEHLREEDGKYNIFGKKQMATDIIEEYINMCKKYPIVYLEDPFDLDEEDAWRDLRKRLDSKVIIVGDDLFATNSKYIDISLADGILLKMNQAGTLSATLRAVEKSKSQGMTLCVSHRSLETEDSFMCDLAVALGVKFIKLGGPRRGDRTSRYNQLIRLEEMFIEKVQ